MSTALRTFCPVHNRGSTCSRDSVVVGLPEPPDGADACLGEEVHGKVAQALLSDHNIGLVLDDLCANLLNVVFLHLKQSSPAGTLVSVPSAVHGICPDGTPLLLPRLRMAIALEVM